MGHWLYDVMAAPCHNGASTRDADGFPGLNDLSSDSHGAPPMRDDHDDSKSGHLPPPPQAQEDPAAFLNRVLGSCPAVIYVLDVSATPARPQAAWVSENVQQLLGFSAQEALVPGWWVAHLHPEDRDSVLSVQKHIISLGHITHTYRFRHGRGHYFWVRDEQRLSRDEAGTPLEIIGSWTDISDLKQAEAEAATKSSELEQANRKLRELDRLKSDFINAATHELRTPLTSIHGYAEFLEDAIGGPLTPTQREYVAQIQGSAHRLEYIINDLLDFARMEAGTFRLIKTKADLAETVNEATNILMPDAHRRGIQLETTLPASPIALPMDPQRIVQVLLNLMGNALKFTKRGGWVRVTLAASPQGARVEVSDSGIGMTADQLPRIFEKFYQVDASATREYGGTGLGLAITRALVEDHGGEIGVWSEPGCGSTFWFTLPMGTDKKN